MKRVIGRFKEFIRYGHTRRKAMYATTLAAAVIFGLSLAFLLPSADHTSIQAAFTVIAEILGVLLGATLLVVERLIDQGQQAVERLRAAFKQYDDLIRSHLKQVNAARASLIDLAKDGKIKLDDPTFVGSEGVPSKTKYRNVVGSLTALALAVDSIGYEEAEEILNDLGFDEKQRDKYVFGEGLLAGYDRASFLKLVEEALDVIVLTQWCSNEVSDLASEVFCRYMQEGIDQALSQLERSRRVLKSKSLAVSIFLLTTTTLAAVLTLFGATEQAVGTPLFVWINALIATGFFLSILVTLFLIEKIFVRP